MSHCTSSIFTQVTVFCILTTIYVTSFLSLKEINKTTQLPTCNTFGLRGNVLHTGACTVAWLGSDQFFQFRSGTTRQ